MSTKVAMSRGTTENLDRKTLAVIVTTSTGPPSSIVSVSPSPKGASPNETSSAAIATPTDNDVLCGRGKGIRKHPGNELYNRLLRENYAEYKSAPKGSKVSIVKKIVSLVRDQRGRFLERQRQKNGNNNNNNNNTSSWVDIGDERAMSKTAQAFRDVKVTIEKQQQQSSSSLSPLSKFHSKKPPSDLEDYSSDCPRRRPTFRERLAMLQQERNQSSSSDESTVESKSDGQEEEISDTETEDSFPMYRNSNR